MKQPIDFDLPLCSVDPITLTGLAIAGIAGIAGGTALSSMASSGGSTTATPSPAPEQPAPQQQAPTIAPGESARPKPKSNTPSFIGGSAVPDSRSFGSKTLLGQ